MLATDHDTGPGTQSPADEDDRFAALVREHQRMIYAQCYRMTGSPDEAEDLAQETFIQAYNHRDGFRGEARISTWLYRIATNLCLNWQKRQRRQQRLREEWSQLEVNAPAAHRDRSQQIEAALMELNAEQRAAVVLTVYQGLTHAEAARVLCCSETTVSWRLFVARKKLKRLLADGRELHIHEQ